MYTVHIRATAAVMCGCVHNNYNAPFLDNNSVELFNLKFFFYNTDTMSIIYVCFSLGLCILKGVMER